MIYVESIGSFFVSEFIWHITFGLLHVPLATFLMTLFLWLFLRTRFFTALIASCGIHMVSVIAFVLLVFPLMVFGVASDFFDLESGEYNTVVAIFSLGIIYAVLQSLCLLLLSKIFSFKATGYILVAFASNLVASGLLLLLNAVTSV
jgi:hypothetical protein